MNKNFIRWGLMIIVWASAAHGHPGFLVDWRAEYPNSGSGNNPSSANINCQLCHDSVTGDQPWNAYGFAIRFYLMEPGNDQFDAFSLVESLNSDGDSAGLTNLQEIEANTQPGWEPGPVNTLFYASSSIPNQLPPAAIDPIQDPLESQRYDLELVDVGSGFTAPVGGVSAPVAGLSNQLF
ncbi:MAG: hypothetical protein ACR2QW_03110, partial [bacterium]